MTDNKSKRTVRRNLLKTACIVALAYLLSVLFIKPLAFSEATFMSLQDKRDFSVTDFFNTVANQRSVKTLDQNIIIVNIDTADRFDIAQIIDLLTICQPGAVGIDATFNQPSGNDDALIEAVKNCPGIVLAMTVTPDGETGDHRQIFKIDEKSFFQDQLSQLTYAAVNLPTKHEKSAVRQFPVYFEGARGRRVNSFAVAVAEKLDPVAVEELYERNHALEIINFPSREFIELEPSEIADNAETIRGKIVLLGALHDEGDKHPTPTEMSMPGVRIHAHAISTIIERQYFTQLTGAQNWLIALGLCFLLVYINITINLGIKGMVVRIMQVLMLYLIIRIGYYLFIEHRVITDFSLSFLMITFGLFACDIWIGLTTICKWGLRRFRSQFLRMIAARKIAARKTDKSKTDKSKTDENKTEENN